MRFLVMPVLLTALYVLPAYGGSSPEVVSMSAISQKSNGACLGALAGTATIDYENHQIQLETMPTTPECANLVANLSPSKTFDILSYTVEYNRDSGTKVTISTRYKNGALADHLIVELANQDGQLPWFQISWDGPAETPALFWQAY